MSTDDPSAKTMRIDIPPQALRRKPAPKPGVSRLGARAGEPLMKDMRKTTGEIAIESADLKALFQGVYDAGFITDLNGNVIDANLRASQFFSYTRREFRELNIGDIVLGAEENVVKTIRENLDHDQFTLLQAWCARKDGSLLPTEISTSRIKLSTKNYLCFFVRDITARKEAEEAVKKARDDLEQEVKERTKINEDLRVEITERKRVEAELNEAIAKLQEHDKAKSEFVSNVSHELKTPLTSINYVAGNMLKGISGPVSDGGRKYLEMIREDCERLRRTVEDILDMSRIEADAMVLDRVKVQFPRFVGRTVESLRMQVEAAELTLGVSMDADKCFVDCDSQKMERVIFNVVKNAIKFNVKNGFIRVNVHVDAQSPGFIAVDVIDSGIGIEPQYLPRIAERFFRVGQYVSGAGLGLAISKDILGRHGGSIEIKSPPPGVLKGTMVSLRLPVAPPPTVLVVYHDEQIRYLITKQMDEYGYRVESRRADELMQGRTPAEKADLVALDWTMPGMEGGIALAKIKGDERFRNVPVLVVVARELEQAKREILEGFEIPTLTSPWKPEKLMSCVDEIVLGRRQRDS